MKLLQLRSDNPKFKTLNFESGLNIIAGLQLSEEDKKTFNGIGKSLSLKLVHLLLGSDFDKKDIKLKNSLEKYGVFYLSLQHQGQIYNIAKDFSSPEYYINDEKIHKKDYPGKLSNIFSDKGLKFRWIFNTFARRFGGDYYSDALRQQGQPMHDYHQRFVNLKLLGIDTELVSKQCDAKEKHINFVKSIKIINESIPQLDKSNLKDLKDERDKLINEKIIFNIAPNFDDLKAKADKLTAQLNNLRNSIHKLKNTLERKQYNLKLAENIKIDIHEVESLYNEAKFFFDNKVLKHFEGAQNFHIKLIANRKKRIKTEIKEIQSELDKFGFEQINMSEDRDEIIKILDNSGALEEYNSIVSRIESLNKKIYELTKYEETLSGFKKKKSLLEIEMANIKASCITYLDDNQKNFGLIEDEFRSIVKKFYGNQGGSLKITETKSAKYLYDIKIDTPRSGSQAIGNAEIFCYDVLLYLLNPNIINFLAHDGCIFSEMDPRQKSMIFKVVIELVKKHDLQYFINIGENSLKDILEKNILSNYDKDYIEKSIILKLYDKNPGNWLMGEEF
jgi:uncharacterized protein YydD (DUF2326 family)